VVGVGEPSERLTLRSKGIWTYLYCAVDSLGQTIDFRQSVRRDQDTDTASSVERRTSLALAATHGSMRRCTPWRAA
jgi:DDE domain